MSRRAKGEGSLYQDDSGRWIGYVDLGKDPETGKRRRKKITQRKGEKKAEVAARLAEAIAGATPDAPKTVTELVDLWRELRADNGKKSVTTLAMLDNLISAHVHGYWDTTKPGATKPEHIEAWLGSRRHHLTGKPLAKSTVEKLRRILVQSFDFGEGREYVTRNPARFAELPPNLPERGERRALELAEAEALLNVADHHRNGAWITVGLTLGMRPGEVSGLTWQAVDLPGGVLTVSRSMSWPDHRPELKKTKTGKTLTLTMPARTVQALTRHKAAQAEERLLMGDKWPAQWRNLVFVSSNGTPMGESNLRKFVAKVAAEAGINGRVVPYDLRHTFVTLLSHEGKAPAEQLADAVGQKDTRMVFEHYRHQPKDRKDTTAADFWNGR